MRKLIEGIINFRQTSIGEYCNKFSKLAFQQKPDALLIACCDSRVVPNVFASSDPGDLFVLRNIGNLVPIYQGDNSSDPSVAGTIEFSLGILNVSDIIVCGHSECGAMHALIENESRWNSSLSPLDIWLKNAIPSYKRFKGGAIVCEEKLTSCDCLSQVNVLQQLDNLKTYPLIIKRLKSNLLRIHGWWFDLATADVYYYNHVREKFIVIDEKEAKNILASLD